MASPLPSQLLIENHLRRNYLLGVANGAIFGFVDAVFAPALVLALFVAQLGGSDLLIGLLPAIYNGGWFLPQFLVSNRVQKQPLKKKFYMSTSAVRVIVMGLLAVVTLFARQGNPKALLASFFVLFVTYSLFAGLGGNAFMTVVAKIIPGSRRGSFFGWRDFTGTAAGLVAGYIVSYALSPQNGLAFPQNFGLIFLITFVAVTVGVSAIGLVYEPSESTAGQEMSFRDQVAEAGRIWKEDGTFRRYLTTRFVLAVADIATPFYAIYATRVLGAPDQIVGLYIGLTTSSAMVTNPIWSWISDHRGHRPVLLIAATAALAMPIVALAVGGLSAATSLPAATMLGLLFLIYGTGRTAANIAFPTLLLDIAPAARRSLYIGFSNSVLGIATFIPAVGGILLDLFGFPPLFILAIALSGVGWWLARGLGHKYVRTAR